MSRPLTGKHAVVTGGGRGIGAAIVHELATLGAEITLMGRDVEQLDRCAEELTGEFNRVFHTVRIDVTNADSVAQAFAETREKAGDPTILVNNAGGVETAPFEKTGADLWQRMIDLNLTGAFLCCKETVPRMIAGGGGRIVNIASTAGLHGYPYVSAYTASKHGLVGLTRSLAMELKKHAITVNAVCPGYTNTDLITRSAQNVAKQTGKTPDEIKKRYASANPHGRLVEPDEVAKQVVWLCLPEQSAITGETIVIDGGEAA